MGTKTHLEGVQERAGGEMMGPECRDNSVSGFCCSEEDRNGVVTIGGVG